VISEKSELQVMKMISSLVHSSYTELNRNLQISEKGTIINEYPIKVGHSIVREIQLNKDNHKNTGSAHGSKDPRTRKRYLLRCFRNTSPPLTPKPPLLLRGIPVNLEPLKASIVKSKKKGTIFEVSYCFLWNPPLENDTQIPMLSTIGFDALVPCSWTSVLTYDYTSGGKT